MKNPPFAVWLFVGVEVYFTGGASPCLPMKPCRYATSLHWQGSLFYWQGSALPSNQCDFTLNHLAVTENPATSCGIFRWSGNLFYWQILRPALVFLQDKPYYICLAGGVSRYTEEI
jgi:hypothetical protein